MAFVTCKQFNQSQDEQDKAFELAQLEQDKKISALEKGLEDEKSRLQDDLTARLIELNGRLNNLKDVEVALNAAKTEGNYNKIKELEAKLQAAKEAQSAGDKGLAEAIEALRKQGLSDEAIQKIIDDAIAKAGGTGRYITRIEPNQVDGTVTYYYSDGTQVTGKLANFGGVIADQKSIVGNGNDEALAVQLSKQPGNMIQLMSDGFYYGTQATYPYLFVDAENGNDSNIGTREHPLRTFGEAITRNPEGIEVHIYMKEDMDHLMPDTYLKSGRYYVRPYGSYFDALPTTKGSVDDFQKSRDLVYDKKSPRLVFKGAKKELHPRNGSNEPQVNIYYLNCLTIPENSFLQFEGMHFINDLNLTLEVKNIKVRNITIVMAASARIVPLSGASVNFVNFSIESRGKPTVNFVTDEDESFAQSLDDEGKQNILLAPNVRGLYRLGLVMDLSEGGANISFRNLMHTSGEEAYPVKCYFYGCQGWNVGAKATTTFNAGSQKEWLAEHFYSAQFDDEEKKVLAPFINIPYRVMKAGV